MTSRKLYIILCATLASTWLLIIGGAYIGNSTFKARSQKIVDLRIESAVMSEQSVRQAKAKQVLDKYETLPGLLAEIVPNEKDQAGVIRQIYQLATASGITIRSISFPASTLGSKATGSSSSSTTTTDSTSQTTAPIPTAQVTQSKPVEGLPGVYTTEITLEPVIDANSLIPYAKLLEFMQKLETNRRIIQATSIAITPKPGTDLVTNFQIKANVYYKP